MSTRSFDVVVVGAGSSGAVVASRLSEDPGRSVALVEAGPDFPREAHDPPAFVAGGSVIGGWFAGAGAATPDVDWDLWSEPVANGRRVHLHRGRMVGGTSMVNGCVAVRAAPGDFADWVRLGATGWSWDEVVPFYEQVESIVPIRLYGSETWSPFQQAFADGFGELGFRSTEELNAPDAWDGVVGPWPQNRRNEVRMGSLVTYVRQARGRPNFEILDRCAAASLVTANGRATGVLCDSAADGPLRLEAAAVVLSMGAYGTPALLQRSGIGPEEHVRGLGLDPVAVLPAGEGLRDHPQCVFALDVAPGAARMWGPAFPVVARGADFWSFPISLDDEADIGGVAFGLTAQEPLGLVTAPSLDPWAPPAVDHRYRDVISGKLFANAWATFRSLAATEALARVGARGGDLERELDTALAERLGTAYHPCGTCAIGRVVDHRLRLLGFENVYVADASVFPANVTNNPNLTCFMVGERAARFVEQDGL